MAIASDESSRVGSVQSSSWVFPVEPNYSWFPDFASNFSCPHLEIFIESEDGRPDQYLLSSVHLDRIKCKDAAFDLMLWLKALMDGSLFLDHGTSYVPLGLTTLTDWDRSFTHRCRSDSDWVTKDFAVEPLGRGESILPSVASHSGARFASNLISAAIEDELVCGALQFLAINGCTWVSLYAMYEFMTFAGLSPKQIAAFGGMTSEEVSQFKATANSYAAVGPFGRHGPNKKKAQKNRSAITLEQATVLLTTAMKEFLIDRCY